jgi:hypothetical protein
MGPTDDLQILVIRPHRSCFQAQPLSEAPANRDAAALAALQDLVPASDGWQYLPAASVAVRQATE